MQQIGGSNSLSVLDCLFVPMSGSLLHSPFQMERAISCRNKRLFVFDYFLMANSLFDSLQGSLFQKRLDGKQALLLEQQRKFVLCVLKSRSDPETGWMVLKLIHLLLSSYAISSS